MALPADSIGFGQPTGNSVVHFIGAFESKSVEMIPGRESFDAAKTQMLETVRQDHVAVDPISPNDKRGEAHPHLERDARLLGQQRDCD